MLPEVAPGPLNESLTEYFGSIKPLLETAKVTTAPGFTEPEGGALTICADSASAKAGRNPTSTRSPPSAMRKKDAINFLEVMHPWYYGTTRTMHGACL